MTVLSTHLYVVPNIQFAEYLHVCLEHHKRTVLKVWLYNLFSGELQVSGFFKAFHRTWCKTVMLFNNWCSSQFKSTVGNGFQVKDFMVCIGVTAVVACHKAKSKIEEVELPQDIFLGSKKAQGNVSLSLLPFCMDEILMTGTCRGNKQNWVGCQHAGRVKPMAHFKSWPFKNWRILGNK